MLPSAVLSVVSKQRALAPHRENRGGSGGVREAVLGATAFWHIGNLLILHL